MRHFWVERILELEPGRRAVGVKSVSLAEDQFEDHFPGNPVLPGIYLLEGLAQTAGVLLECTTGGTRVALMVSINRARFTEFARPGDQVRLEVTIEGVDAETARARGEAVVDGREVAAASITFRLVPPERLIAPLYLPLWRQGLAVLRGEYPELVHD